MNVYLSFALESKSCAGVGCAINTPEKIRLSKQPETPAYFQCI